jgi:hypothetical protein
MNAGKLTPAAAFLLALGAALSGPLPAVAQTSELRKVHALLVLDTNGANQVGESVKVDKENMLEVLKVLPREKVETTVLEGRNATPAGVLNYYEKLQTGPSEAILLYYSGHGGTDPNQGHVLGLAAGLLTRARLRQAMEQKNAGLVVLLTDCCSTAFRMPPVPMAPQFTPDPRVVRDLFLRSRGVVDITAAREGSSAWGDNLDGGVFTRALRQLAMASSLRELDSNHDGTLSWDEFFPRLRSETQKAFKEYKREMEEKGKPVTAKEQTPQAFEITLKDDPGTGNSTPPLPAASTVPASNPRPSYNLGFTFAENQGTGLRITKVGRGSPAARAGLEARDVIVSVGGVRLSSRGQLNRAVENSNGNLRLVLRDFRTNKLYYRDLRLEKKR